MVTDGLTEAQWDQLISCAQAFSADCCKSINNYVSTEFGDKMKL
jgi:fructokinase